MKSDGMVLRGNTPRPPQGTEDDAKAACAEIGKEQSYIARVEKGEVDMQLSSFFRIAHALNIELTPSFN